MDEDAKRPKAVSLCWVCSGHEEGIEGDGWIDGERTHVLVSSEEKLVVESRPGSDPDESTVNLVWLRSEKENGQQVEKRGTENGLT